MGVGVGDWGSDVIEDLKPWKIFGKSCTVMATSLELRDV